MTVRQELVLARDRNQFQLGAWLAHRHEVGAVAEDTWTKLVPYLVGPYASVQALAQDLPALLTIDGPLALLREWAWTLVPSDGSAAPLRDREMALRWATVLLARRITPPAVPELIFDEARAVGQSLLGQVSSLAEHPEPWVPVIEGDVPGKLDAVRQAAEAAIRREEQERERRIADAVVPPETRAAFAVAQTQQFDDHNHLRYLLLQHNAVKVEKDHADAFIGSRHQYGTLSDKWVFIENPDDAARMHDLGLREAIQQQGRLSEALAAMASVREGGDDSLGVALQAISDLRNAGLRPDVVLIPHGLSVRPKLHQHPAFTWATAPAVFDEGHRELGRLDGLPVYETV